MPLYEYACEDCGNLIEILIRGDEQPQCDCGSRRLEKQLSVPAAHTSGSRSELPIGGPAPQAGGCGLPACQTRCQFE